MFEEEDQTAWAHAEACPDVEVTRPPRKDRSLPCVLEYRCTNADELQDSDRHDTDEHHPAQVIERKNCVVRSVWTVGGSLQNHQRKIEGKDKESTENELDIRQRRISAFDALHMNR